MTHLVYCVLRRTQAIEWRLPTGVDGRPISLTAADGLAAACSIVPEVYARPNLHRLKAFASVIGALHRMCAVLPLRYGCLLPTQGDVAQLLQKRRREFALRLHAVEGCVEMGVRVLLNGKSDQLPEHAPLASGAAYLRARKRDYGRLDARRCEAAALARRCKEAFGGLFLECQSEFSPGPGRLYGSPTLSLCFLVRDPLRESFCEAFRGLTRNEPVKMLLTGPWPPYNFANLSDRKPVQ